MRQQEKEALQLKIQTLEKEITHQIQDWRSLGKRALWIGGGLAAVYLLVRSLPITPDNEESSLENPEIETQEETSIVWSVAQGLATSLLLAAAKEALIHLIDKLPPDHDA